MVSALVRRCPPATEKSIAGAVTSVFCGVRASLLVLALLLLLLQFHLLLGVDLRQNVLTSEAQ